MTTFTTISQEELIRGLALGRAKKRANRKLQQQQERNEAWMKAHPGQRLPLTMYLAGEARRLEALALTGSAAS